MKNFILIFFLVLNVLILGQVNYTHYSKAKVEQDIDFAFGRLTNIHPLFLEKGKLNVYKDRFSEIKKSIKDSMTQNEVYMLIAPLFASLNDGHTGIIVPMEQRQEYTKSGGKSFPFFVNISDDSVRVEFYCANDTSLFQGGEQILEINGIKTEEILRNMESFFSGEAASIKQKEIANKFRFLIWMIYGFEDDYDLVIKDNQNQIKKMTIPGVTSDEFMQNFKRRPKADLNYYKLDIIEKKETAVMTIKTFSDLDGFCLFADSAFAKIKGSKIKNLVLDIRNNGGGRSVVVDSLMNYLTDKEYAQYKKIQVRISKELKEYYEQRYPERMDWINSFSINELITQDHNVEQPCNNNLRFNGNLFLLTNSSSYSAAATFAGVFKELQLGKIIGEETGGTISYYGDFWFSSTPNTKIRFYISPKRFIQYGGEEYKRGVIPDYLIKDKDNSIMDFVNNLID